MDGTDRRDVSVLPNNNHPDKFLTLEARTLPGMFQVGALVSSQRHWQNRVYSQRERSRTKRDSRAPPGPEEAQVEFVDRYLEKHITPFTLKSNIKTNPLYADFRATDSEDRKKNNPSWTVQDFDTQTVHGNLGEYLKEDQKTARDLDFWLEDLYTPGFDSLLRKTEAEQRRRKLWRILAAVLLSLCGILVLVLVPVLVLQKKD